MNQDGQLAYSVVFVAVGDFSGGQSRMYWRFRSVSDGCSGFCVDLSIIWLFPSLSPRLLALSYCHRRIFDSGVWLCQFYSHSWFDSG
jgi:hypothetical protein